MARDARGTALRVPAAVFVVIGGLTVPGWWRARAHDGRVVERHASAAVAQLRARLSDAMRLRLALLRRAGGQLAAATPTRVRLEAHGVS